MVPYREVIKIQLLPNGVKIDEGNAVIIATARDDIGSAGCSGVVGVPS